MADIRIKDLATTASTTASDDFMAVDGTTNGTRKLSAATPSFATSVTVPGVSGPTATNLTLAGGSTGASLVLGQGTNASTVFTGTGTGLLSFTKTTGNPEIRAIAPAGGAGVFRAYTPSTSTLSVYGIYSVLEGNGNKWENGFYGTLDYVHRYNDAEKWRFTTTGNLLIGTTTDISGTGGLKVAGTSTASSTTSGALQVGSNVGLSGNAGGASYFGGAVTVNGTGTSTISSATTGAAGLMLRNTAAGAGNYGILGIGNDSDANAFNIITFSSTYSGSGANTANFSRIENNRASAGLNLVAGGAGGTVNIYAGGEGAGSKVATFSSTLDATFAGAVTGKLITTQADDTSSGFVVKRSVNPYIDFYDGGTSGTIRAEISATNDGVSGGTLVLAPRNAAGTITTAVTLTKDLAATFAGTVIAPAATTALAPMRIPHGTAPTSPVNGDMWTTTAGLFVRINGVTVGPLS